MISTPEWFIPLTVLWLTFVVLALCIVTLDHKGSYGFKFRFSDSQFPKAVEQWLPMGCPQGTRPHSSNRVTKVGNAAILQVILRETVGDLTTEFTLPPRIVGSVLFRLR